MIELHLNELEQDTQRLRLGLIPGRETAYLWIERYRKLAESYEALVVEAEDMAEICRHEGWKRDPDAGDWSYKA